MFRTLSPGVSILVTQKPAPRRQKGKSGSVLLCNRRSRQSEHQISVFSILCMGRCKPLGSPNLFLSYVPQLSGASPVSLVTFWSDRWLSLAFPSSSAVILGWWWQNLLDHSLGIRHSHSEARNCWWWWHFILIGNGRRYFHFTTISLFQAIMVFFFISCCSFFGVWG